MSSYEYKGPDGQSISSLQEVMQAICQHPFAEHQIKEQQWVEWSEVTELVEQIAGKTQEIPLLWHYVGPNKMGYMSLFRLQQCIVQAPQEVHLVRQEHWYDWLQWTAVKSVYQSIIQQQPSQNFPAADFSAKRKARYKPDAVLVIKNDQPFLIDRYQDLRFPHISNQSVQLEDIFFRGLAHCLGAVMQATGKAMLPDIGSFVVRRRKQRKFYNHFGSQQVEETPAKKYIHLLTNRKTEVLLGDESRQARTGSGYPIDVIKSLPVGEKDASFSLVYWLQHTQKPAKQKQLSSRRQLAVQIARQADIPVAVSVGLLQYCLFHVINALAQGHRIHLPHVGRFEVKKRTYGKHVKHKIVFRAHRFLENLVEQAAGSHHA